jgi:nitrile hydratase accessory protein
MTEAAPDPDDTTTPFAEPWQAQAFALAVRLSREGHFTWAEWTQALGREIAQAGDEASADNYYDHWLAALEQLIDGKKLVTSDELQTRKTDWLEAAMATPHGEPIVLGRKAPARDRS